VPAALAPGSHVLEQRRDSGEDLANNCVEGVKSDEVKGYSLEGRIISSSARPAGWRAAMRLKRGKVDSKKLFSEFELGGLEKYSIRGLLDKSCEEVRRGKTVESRRGRTFSSKNKKFIVSSYVLFRRRERGRRSIQAASRKEGKRRGEKM